MILKIGSLKLLIIVNFVEIVTIDDQPERNSKRERLERLTILGFVFIDFLQLSIFSMNIVKYEGNKKFENGSLNDS